MGYLELSSTCSGTFIGITYRAQGRRKMIFARGVEVVIYILINHIYQPVLYGQNHGACTDQYVSTIPFKLSPLPLYQVPIAICFDHLCNEATFPWHIYLGQGRRKQGARGEVAPLGL